MIIFISGGARSGKSHFAENTALSLNKTAGGSLYYIATAKKSDDEMEERIRIHQQERENEWKTVEEPYDLLPFLFTRKKDDVVLLDCITIWLSNVMFEKEFSLVKIENIVKSWLKLAHENHFHLLIVSNDVNEAIPCTDEVVFSYMYALQQLHQSIVKQSDTAVQVKVGIPIYWKGEIR